MKREIKCSLILLTTAAIWGMAYVTQKLALNSVGPLTLITLRGMLAWMFLIPCGIVLDKYFEKSGKKTRSYDKTVTIKIGIGAGLLQCIASVLQAYGIRQCEAGKAGFLITLYIVIVPILSIYIGKKITLQIWISVGMALIGTYFLCATEGFAVETSDILLLLGAVVYAIYIVIISAVCHKVNSIKMSIIQFCVSSGCTLLPAILVECPRSELVLDALPAIAYTGIFCCGIGYTIQIIGQDGVSPTVASLILSFESVFALLAGWIFLQEMLSPRELLGCAIVICAVILAQCNFSSASSRIPPAENN